MVFAVCLRTCRDAHDAEDATQAVFLSLAVQCKSGNPVRHLPAWLRQVAKRTSLDVRKSRKRREAREAKKRAENDGVTHDDHLGDGRNGLTSLDLQDVGAVLSEELAKLPAKYRLPLVSLYFGGLSREEIAEQLGLKPGALGVRLHRARHMLGERLKRRGAVSEGSILAMGILPVLDNAFGQALTVRTSEAAAHLMLGHDLGATVSANVLATVNGTFNAVSIGRLKVVASALLVMVGSVAGGGTAWAHANENLPQVISNVQQWLERIRSGIQLPSLRLQLLSDATSDFTNDAEFRPNQDEVLALSKPVMPSVNEPMMLPLDASPMPSLPAPSRVANSAPMKPKTLADIDYPKTRSPQVATETSAPDKKPFVRDSLRAEPTLASAAGATRLGAGRSGTPSKNLPMLNSETSAAGSYTGSGSGAVELTQGPTAGSEHLAKAAGQPNGLVGGPRLSIGAEAGTKGSFTLSGGTLVAGVEDIGRRGKGTFTQTGGRNVATQILLGDEAGGDGTYALAGGSLELATGLAGEPAGIVVGGAGSGTLLLGSASSPGFIVRGELPMGGAMATVSRNASGISYGPFFLVRATSGGYGLVKGWGQVTLSDGTLINNGRVIADGFGRDGELAFAGFARITNDIDNPASGANGWFAINGGKLTMPATFNPTGGTYTWGENSGDPTLDLINSVRLVLQPPPDQLSVSLLATDHTTIPALPAGHQFIGVWSVDTFGQNDVEGIDLTVRYDHLLAEFKDINESSLKLWYFRDGLWSRVTGDNFWLDSSNHLIGGRVDGSIDYFAVSAPEPGGIVMLAIAGTTMLLRRRRAS